MKVCLYIRLSSEDDDLKWKAESESITNQRALLTQYLKRHRSFIHMRSWNLWMTASPVQMATGLALNA